MGASCLLAKVKGKAKPCFGYGLLSYVAPFYYRYIYYRYIYYQGVATVRQQNHVTDMNRVILVRPPHTRKYKHNL